MHFKVVLRSKWSVCCQKRTGSLWCAYNKKRRKRKWSHPLWTFMKCLHLMQAWSAQYRIVGSTTAYRINRTVQLYLIKWADTLQCFIQHFWHHFSLSLSVSHTHAHTHTRVSHTEIHLVFSGKMGRFKGCFGGDLIKWSCGRRVGGKRRADYSRVAVLDRRGQVVQKTWDGRFRWRNRVLADEWLLEQSQHTRESISDRKMPHKHDTKDPSHLQ